MASGKPVIAPKEGGYLESVVDGETGVLIEDINSRKLVDAIVSIGKDPQKFEAACIKRARKFDVSVFIKKLKETIDVEK